MGKHRLVSGGGSVSGRKHPVKGKSGLNQYRRMKTPEWQVEAAHEPHA